jgi:hypothetical protein
LRLSALFNEFLLKSTTNSIGVLRIINQFGRFNLQQQMSNKFPPPHQKKKKNKKQKNKKGGKEKESFCMRNEKMAQDGKQEEHGPNDFLEGINVL